MATKKVTFVGMKAQLVKLSLEIKKKKKELAKLLALEKGARGKWTKGYRAFMSAAAQLAELKVYGTKKELELKKKIKDWPKDNVSLTKDRDAFRSQMKEVEQSLVELATKLAIVTADETSQTRATDEVVTQVFALNEVVVRVAGDREDYLKRQIFPKLFDDNGQLRSQVTLDSTNGLRRVVALVNVMTIVKGDLAGEAKRLIESFFERFKQPAEVNQNLAVLYELTRQLLITKTEFKVGPELYRFLAVNLDSEIFPELAQAQALLRQSIRSEKSSSYIRLYERKARTDKWAPVPQS